MSQSSDRSGRSPEWVRGLAELTPAECHAYLVSLMEIALKECDVPTCDLVAIYRVSFHGCSRFTVCGMHRAVWASGVTQAIQRNGQIVCDDCNQHADTLEAAMQWHPI